MGKPKMIRVTKQADARTMFIAVDDIAALEPELEYTFVRLKGTPEGYAVLEGMDHFDKHFNLRT